MNQSGKYLHRFSWLDEEDIGELDPLWNWLAIEYPINKNAKNHSLHLRDALF